MLPVRNLPYFRGQYRNATQSTLPEKGSVKSYTRTHTYQATHVADESNGTRWMAADTDSSPFITVDLKEIRKVGECQFYFTRPTEGHTWRLEKSIDGKHWQMCAEQGKYKHALHILLRR